MMKRIILLALSLMILLSATVTAFATSYMGFTRVYDSGGLLTEQEEELLAQRLDTLSEQYECDVVVATVETLGDMDAEEYSDFHRDSFDYGMGETDNCIMLLVCMEYRDYALTPYGGASKYFPLSRQEDMINNFKPYLSDGDIYSAFDTFADDCEYTFLSDGDIYSAFDTFADDCEYTFENYGKVTVKPLWIGAAVIIGVIVAFIVVLVMKSQLKTVRFQSAASNYLKNGSLNVTQSRDIFLYSTITRTAKPKNTSSGGGSGSAGPRSSGKF